MFKRVVPGETTDRPPPERRFTTVDALVLLAALSLGVTWTIEARTVLISFATADGLFRGPLPPLASLFAPLTFVVIRRSLHPLAAFFAPLTFALSILRLRQPRSSLAHCLRRPGASACAVAAIVLLLEVVNCFLDLATRFSDVCMLGNSIHSYANARILSGLTLFSSIAFSIGESPGLAVAGAYLALWSSRLWRSESTWIDRAGHALGWFWIITAVAFILLPRWER
jgi:hypothetical protein